MTRPCEISVIVPCFNEEENLRELVERVQGVFERGSVDGEIVLVDDASRDRTRQVIESLVTRFSNVTGAYHDVNRGIVGGWQTGLRASRGRWVVTIDADMQYAPEDILLLYKESMHGDCDLVQGWRRQHEDSAMALRYVLSIGWSWILNRAFAMDLQDVKSGFVLYRRDAFADILSFRGRYYYFQHFITIAAHGKGYRIKQVPVKFYARQRGTSFITHPIWFSLKACSDLPTAYAEFRRDRRAARGR